MVQESLLPAADNNDLPFVGYNVPARHLSGDFYDYFLRDDGCICFNLGDVAGKGANAALLMVKASSLFRCLSRDIKDPGKLFYRLNQELCDNTPGGMFITMVAGVYQPVTRRLSIVNAGHVPPFIVCKDGGVRMLDGEAAPLGIVPEQNFPVTELNLGQDSLYICTDGLVERNINGAMVMDMDAVVDVCRTLGHLPGKERLPAVVRQLRKDACRAHDDMTIMVLEDIDRE